MAIKIEKNLNLKASLESICDRLNLGYGALNDQVVKELARDSERLLAIFPDSMKPGASVHHDHGGACITMLRRANGWYISDVRYNINGEDGMRQRLTPAQKSFLNELDMAA